MKACAKICLHCSKPAHIPLEDHSVCSKECMDRFYEMLEMSACRDCNKIISFRTLVRPLGSAQPSPPHWSSKRSAAAMRLCESCGKQVDQPTAECGHVLCRVCAQGPCKVCVPPARAKPATKCLICLDVVWNPVCLLYTSPSPRDS